MKCFSTRHTAGFLARVYVLDPNFKIWADITEIPREQKKMKLFPYFENVMWLLKIAFLEDINIFGRHNALNTSLQGQEMTGVI